MPSLPVSEIASPSAPEFHTAHLGSCSCTQSYGVRTSSIEKFSGESLPYRRFEIRRKQPSKRVGCGQANFFTGVSSDHGEKGSCTLKRDALHRHPKNFVKKVVSCNGSSSFGSGPDRGGNLFHGFGRKWQNTPGIYQRASFARSSHSTDMGYADTQMYQAGMCDHTRLESYERALFLETTMYIPQPEALDPFSQLLYNHAMGKNLQWWRFLSYCRAQVHNTLVYRIPRMKYSLVGKDYRRVFLPSGLGAGALTVPAFSIPMKQDPFSTTLDHINNVAAEFFGWFEQMGGRYGTSLLSLLVLGYWIQGFRCFPWMAMSFYLKDGLQVDPATLQFWQSTVNLPMVAKPIYGIVSDVIYIGGDRRMPYLMLAGALQVLSWSTVALHSGIRSSVGPLMGVLLVSNVGAAIAEVVNDALVAESVQKERGRSKGELQSFVWLALAIGGVMGNLTGGLVLSRLSSTTMFTVFTILVAGQLVVTSIVKEKSFNFKVLRPLKSSKSLSSTSALKVLKLQAVKLVDLVSRPEIARPLAWFAASYAVIPALGGSLFFYQTQYLNIHPTFLGLAKVMGQMGLLAGSLIYNRYLKKTSPRQVLMAVQVLLSVCMLADILLVSRLNIKLGIPDHLYVLGASAFVEAIAQFKVLPFSVLLTQLCPAGSEGSLLAFFMSCHCLASILSGYMGTILASFLHLSADSFVGLPLGILIQSVAALIPLFWISCIPSNARKTAVI